MADKKGEITLNLPADRDFVLLARMALSGLGMLAGLDVDLIDDLRAAIDECCDCLLHQPFRAERLDLRAAVQALGHHELVVTVLRAGVIELGGAEGLHEGVGPRFRQSCGGIE